MPTCWSCPADTNNAPFCPACGKIQPGRPRDLFSVLGVAPRFHLETATLEKSHRELSRLLHPDRFAKADARERRFSLEQSTALNQAIKTLKDPVARAEYLLRKEGYVLATDEAGKPGAGEKLPLAFYEEVMEDREALMDAKGEGPQAVQKVADKILARRATALTTVDAAFTRWEATGEREALAPAVSELAKLRYYARFLDEVEGRPHG